MHDDEFRRAVRAWLAENVSDELRGAGGPGREHEAYRERLAFDRRLAAAGWTCLGWPVEHGGRGATLAQQVAFHEEYARAGGPARVGYLGEELLGPTLIAYGTPAQRRRFLPRIRAVEELWCQGYSEPGAGSDLAAVATRARLVGDEWVIDGQKVWTSLAHVADWCFLLARTHSPGTRPRQAGLSYLLVPMRQPGVTVRPIRQLTGTSEFNEVFFAGARTSRDMVVGEVGQGWRVAMGTLTFERGAATLGQQVGFQRELDALVSLARHRGVAGEPQVRDTLTRAFIGLWALRAHTLHTMTEVDGQGPGQGASTVKLLWSRWHQRLGELAMQVRGASGAVARDAPYDLDEWQRLFLFSRADTIYGGSDEIQRGIIAERVLGLPRQARG
ncbi:acyl-CoA dehydrogenase family protein [Salinispora arenicola]|uniref:Acyl-CoA dehydrogenase n=1 Tax=Salinispora arenicola TaxID=168697 RepID=A0A542XR77_SALAC|nr:acyl-CoA dehydrogenase family protein [Salinispora arenicola]MCN0153695.1 acyl-CoA dehydrogenase family protein [Salinispora arenicola]TQL38346.1 alkylation response protein AidB-like acyl-CoA dehydrogenase [Salinispora arenicola]GIM85471.1 acyl-CoA dehydrogenase [Salinispora arenicola]